MEEVFSHHIVDVEEGQLVHDGGWQAVHKNVLQILLERCLVALSGTEFFCPMEVLALQEELHPLIEGLDCLAVLKLEFSAGGVAFSQHEGLAELVHEEACEGLELFELVWT